VNVLSARAGERAFMLNCKQVVKIVSSEDRLSWRKRFEVRFHLFMCRHCSKYAKQLELLKTGFRALLHARSWSIDQSKIKALEDKVVDKLK
jgi:hypothetical protein